MDKRIRAAMIINIIALITIIVVSGCGNADKKAAADAGCPSGTYFAQATDILTFTYGVCGWTLTSPVLTGSLQSIVGVTCVSHPYLTVTDKDGNPKNDVCVTFQTNGTWYTDSNHSTILPGEGVTNKIVKKTDHNGAIELYWRTYPIPLSSAATNSATAGTDRSYVNTDITAISGAAAAQSTAAVTVKGCEKETAAELHGGTATCP
jgi:hypothetical protein